VSDWRALRLAVTAEQVAVVEQVLEDNGALAVTITDAEDNPLFEPPPGAAPLWPRCQIQAIFGQDEDDALLRAACQNALIDALGDAAPAIVISDIQDQNWTRVWMDAFQPMRFGQRLWIVPSWHPCPDPDAVNLRLDPGLAFGTGTHPTTALCLEFLDSLASMPSRVLDFGCGSGVLALAALMLGAQQADGTDIDPQALSAMQDNAQRNGFGSRVTTALPEDFHAEHPYPMVMANILSGPLQSLAPLLTQYLEPGGTLVLSGLLTEQAEAVMQAYPDIDFDAPASLGEWCRLTGTKRKN